MASVVVVGGGLAGLVCAWRLARSGHDVEVLEAGERPGGRFARQTARRPEPAGSGQLGAVCAILAPERPVVPVADPGLRVALRSGHWLNPRSPGDWMRAGGGALRGGPRAARLGGALARTGPRPDSRLDPEDAAAWLASRAGPELCAALVDPLAAGLYGGARPADLSLPLLLQGLRAVALDGWQRAPLSPAALAERLASLLRVRCRCRVERVETEEGGARVRFEGAGRQRSVVADAVALAVAPERILALCPGLGGAERTLLEGVRERRVWEIRFSASGGRAAPASTLFLSGVSSEEAGLLLLRAPEPGDDDLWRGVLAADERPPPGSELPAAAAARALEGSPLAFSGVDLVSAQPVGVRSAGPRAVARERAFDRRTDPTPRLAFGRLGSGAVGVDAELGRGIALARELTGRLPSRVSRPSVSRPASTGGSAGSHSAV